MDYDDLCKALDANTKAHDSLAKTNYLLYMQRQQAEQTPTRATYRTLSLAGYYNLQNPQWQQIATRNSKRQEIHLWYESGDDTDALLLADNDGVDITTGLAALTTSLSTIGPQGNQSLALNLFVIGANPWNGNNPGYGSPPSSRITIRSTESIYAASINISNAQNTPIVGGNGWVSYIETEYASEPISALDFRESVPSAGELLKPSMRVREALDVEEDALEKLTNPHLHHHRDLV